MLSIFLLWTYYYQGGTKYVWRFHFLSISIFSETAERLEKRSYKMGEDCFSWNSWKFLQQKHFLVLKRFFYLLKYSNQSRICGKRVGLGLFLSDSLESQSYEFIEITHRNDCRKVRSNRKHNLWENRKMSKNSCFLVIFGLILALFLTSLSYDFDALAHSGVEWLCKLLWKWYGQFFTNLKFLLEGREEKNDTVTIT